MPGLVLLCVLVGLGAGAWYALSESRGNPATKPPVRVLSGGRVLLSGPPERLRAWLVSRLRQWLAAIPPRRVRRRGAARVIFELDRRELLQRVRRRAAQGGGDVPLTERVVAARATLPVVKQALRNNCETAALSMLLAVNGKRVDQLALQRQLPSGAQRAAARREARLSRTYQALGPVAMVWLCAI